MTLCDVNVDQKRRQAWRHVIGSDVIWEQVTSHPGVNSFPPPYLRCQPSGVAKISSVITLGDDGVSSNTRDVTDVVVVVSGGVFTSVYIMKMLKVRLRVNTY